MYSYFSFADKQIKWGGYFKLPMHYLMSHGSIKLNLMDYII